MQITLPDHPKIASRAVAAGFATIEEYVRHLIEEDAGPLDEEDRAITPLSHDDWRKHLEELLAAVEPGNPNVDDSRESIYLIR
jgi:hypothetical protein